ncbi:MAG: cytochrome b562 [Cardiobacteriaceae bacterium]|nr:cytochrome b562 [Cardiobacteriaceae bacterium]
MKKILLAAAMGAAFATTAMASTQSNAVEIKTLTETVTTTNAAGETVTETRPLGVVVELPGMATLPDAVVTDASMDLEKTMKMMGKNFKALNKADDLLAMHKEAEELAVYASQGEAIGLDPNKASDEAKAEYARLMQKLRGHIAELQQAIEQKDADKAKAALEATNEVRKEGHKYFDV